MKTSKINLVLTLVTILLAGASVSEAASAAGGGHGGGGHGGGGHGGGGRGGGVGWHGGGGGWHGGGGGWRGGGGRRVGIYLGVPVGIGLGSGYYPYSYYGAPYYGTPYYSPAPAYYPPVQPAPMIYTEQSDDPQINTQEAPINSEQSTQGSWWYYCVDANAYYPNVNQCPGGWLRVAPQPPSDSGNQPALNSSPAP